MSRWLARPGDAKDLAEKIRTALTDRGSAVPATGAYHAWPLLAERYADILRQT